MDNILVSLSAHRGSLWDMRRPGGPILEFAEVRIFIMSCYDFKSRAFVLRFVLILRSLIFIIRSTSVNNEQVLIVDGIFVHHIFAYNAIFL